MRVVFEMECDANGAIYVVDVKSVDETRLIGLYRGVERQFSLRDIKNATTVTGRSFSLRPYQAPNSTMTGLIEQGIGIQDFTR